MLIQGDCLKKMAEMPEYSIDLIVTSPPYGNMRNYNGYEFDFGGTAREMYRVLKEGCIAVWVIGDSIRNGNRILDSFRHGLGFQEAGFKMHDIMIYRKKNTPFMRRNAYTNCHEFMFVLAKGTPKTFNPIMEKTRRSGVEMLVHNKGADGINRKVPGLLKKEKVRTNIWEYAVGLGGTTTDRIAFKHPAVFPEKLAEDHILSWSNPGDVVLDPFCGSGTTLKMAAKLGRKYIGIDVSEEYLDIARKRLPRE